jgi:transcription antitermination factor NusG
VAVKNVAKVGWESTSGALPEESVPNAFEFASCSPVVGTHWYAVQTRYRFERKVTAQIQRQGFETFLPIVKQIHRWSDRDKAVDTILFPGYMFARLHSRPASIQQILKTAGVIGIVAFSGAAAPVPPKQIEDLRKLLTQNIPCALHAFLKAGQKVRIRGGCLDGLEGILEEAGQKNLVISVDSIQRAIAITIEGYELELI